MQTIYWPGVAAAATLLLLCIVLTLVFLRRYLKRNRTAAQQLPNIPNTEHTTYAFLSQGSWSLFRWKIKLESESRTLYIKIRGRRSARLVNESGSTVASLGASLLGKKFVFKSGDNEQTYHRKMTNERLYDDKGDLIGRYTEPYAYTNSDGHRLISQDNNSSTGTTGTVTVANQASLHDFLLLFWFLRPGPSD